MSTPFQLLPAPSAIRWADAPPSPIGPVWSPWPAPTIATLKRSTVWPAPTIYTVTWMPPSIVHLAPADPVLEAPPSRWRRLVLHLSKLFGRRR